MQFVLLIYQGTTPIPSTPAWDALPAAEQKKIYADYAEFNKVPGVAPGPPLGLPETATTVQVKDGQTRTSTGPYLGSKEPVAGYAVVEADDLDAAVKVAARIPAARLGGAIEVRPCAKYW